MLGVQESELEFERQAWLRNIDLGIVGVKTICIDCRWECDKEWWELGVELRLDVFIPERNPPGVPGQVNQATTAVWTLVLRVARPSFLWNKTQARSFYIWGHYLLIWQKKKKKSWTFSNRECLLYFRAGSLKKKSEIIFPKQSPKQRPLKYTRKELNCSLILLFNNYKVSFNDNYF